MGQLLGGMAEHCRSGATDADSAATVLVVSASAESRASLVIALEQGGFLVHSTATAQEAASAILRWSVSLLVVMGPAVTGTILALRQATSLPILALLPSMTEEVVLDAFAAGADDCQSAIIGSKEVALRVRAMLRRSEQAGRGG